MTDINDLAAAIRAGLDEDERLAGELAAWAHGPDDEGAFDFDKLIGNPMIGPFGGQSAVRNWGTGQDIAKLSHPTRVLAEAASKRALLDKLLAEPHHHWPGVSACIAARFPDEPCGCGRDDRVTAYLRILAQPYQEQR